MTVQTTYRTCPRSGLQFEKQAEALIKINAVTAVVALLVGGLLAIGVALGYTLYQQSELHRLHAQAVDTAEVTALHDFFTPDETPGAARGLRRHGPCAPREWRGPS